MSDPRSNVIPFPFDRITRVSTPADADTADADDVLDQAEETRCWGDRPRNTEVLSPEETARFETFCQWEFPKVPGESEGCAKERVEWAMTAFANLKTKETSARVARMIALFAGKA